MTTADPSNASVTTPAAPPSATALSPSPTTEESRKFAVAAAELAANTRCTHVVVLDLRGRSPVTEFFVVATGTSAVQMRTVADEVSDLGKRMNFKPLQTSGQEGAKWIVVDCVNVIVHIFDSQARDFYDLELLWGDSPRIDWRGELGLPPEPERVRTAIAKGIGTVDSSGVDEEDAELEEARLEGRDVDEEEGDYDIDEDAEADAPVVVELPDLSGGANSVEFVEVDSPTKRKAADRSGYGTPVTDADEAADEFSARSGNRPVTYQSLDEDDAERDSENAADVDVEAVSDEDLPESQMELRPFGGVSASLSEDAEDSEFEDTSASEAGEDDEEIAPAPRGARKVPAPKKDVKQPAKGAAKTTAKPKTKAKTKAKAPAKPAGKAAAKKKAPAAKATKGASASKAKAKPKGKAPAKKSTPVKKTVAKTVAKKGNAAAKKPAVKPKKPVAKAKAKPAAAKKTAKKSKK